MGRKGVVRSRRKKHKKIRYDIERFDFEQQWKAFTGYREVGVIRNVTFYLGRKNEKRFGKFLIGLGIFLLFLWILPHPYEAEIDKYTWHTLSYFSDFQLIFYGFGLILIGSFVLTSKLYYKKRQKLMWLFLILLVLLGYYLH